MDAMTESKVRVRTAADIEKFRMLKNIFIMIGRSNSQFYVLSFVKCESIQLGIALNLPIHHLYGRAVAQHFFNSVRKQ